MISVGTNKDEFDRYIANVVTINRKILLTLFDLELTKNDLLKKKIELIRNSKVDRNYFFFEGIIDFKSLILLLSRLNSKKEIELLIDINKENEIKILKKFLIDSPLIRNDLWHNCIEYNNPKKYYGIICSIKNAYELFQNNNVLNKSKLFENSIKYLNICLEYFKNFDSKKL